jgi:hypothetical protein
MGALPEEVAVCAALSAPPHALSAVTAKKVAKPTWMRSRLKVAGGRGELALIFMWVCSVAIRGSCRNVEGTEYTKMTLSRV